MTIPSADELFDLLGPEPEPAPTVAWAHQAKEFDEHKDDRCRALLWSMRTGKSKAVIDKAEYQFGEGAIEGPAEDAPRLSAGARHGRHFGEVRFGSLRLIAAP